MSQPSRQTAFRVLYFTTALVLLYYSVQTVWDGVEHGDGLHAIIIGGLEAISAILFLIPRTLMIGGIGLLLTIGIAFAIHAISGQFAGNLLIYAAAVWMVMVFREGHRAESPHAPGRGA